MATKPLPVEKAPKSSLEWLMRQIDAYLAKNKQVSEAAFGWASIKDTGLVERLRGGGDVTTRKFDALVRYMSNSKAKDSTNGKQTKDQKQIKKEADKEGAESRAG